MWAETAVTYTTAKIIIIIIFFSVFLVDLKKNIVPDKYGFQLDPIEI